MSLPSSSKVHKGQRVRLGASVKRFREEHELTQAELGASLFVSRRVVAKWERYGAPYSIGLALGALSLRTDLLRRNIKTCHKCGEYACKHLGASSTVLA